MHKWTLLLAESLSLFFSLLGISLLGVLYDKIPLVVSLGRTWRARGLPAFKAQVRQVAKGGTDRLSRLERYLRRGLLVALVLFCVVWTAYHAPTVVDRKIITLQKGQRLVTLSGYTAVEEVRLNGVTFAPGQDYKFSGDTLDLMYPALGGDTLDIKAARPLF